MVISYDIHHSESNNPHLEDNLISEYFKNLCKVCKWFSFMDMIWFNSIFWLNANDWE